MRCIHPDLPAQMALKGLARTLLDEPVIHPF